MRTTRIAALLAAVTIGAGALAMPFAPAVAVGSAKPTACSQQERQVAKAEAQLEKVTEVFAAQEKKTKKTKKAKKAQVQRLAKAEARLAECTAAQTTAG